MALFRCGSGTSDEPGKIFVYDSAPGTWSAAYESYTSGSAITPVIFVNCKGYSSITLNRSMHIRKVVNDVIGSDQQGTLNVDVSDAYYVLINDGTSGNVSVALS